MTNLFILMLLYLTYAAVSFWLFNYNFLSPSFVFSMSLSATLCFAYYAANNLAMLFAIGLKTFSIFATAGFIFIATEFLVYSMHTVKHFQNKPIQTLTDNPQPLEINWQIQWAYTAFLIMSLFLAVIVLYMNTGGGSWGQRMKAYKEMLLYHPENLRMRFIMAQIQKLNILTIDLFGYVMLYNISVCKVPLRKSISYILDIPIYLVYSAVTTGARQTSIEGILFLVMIYITINVKPEKKRKLWGFMIRSLPIAIVLALCFTYAGTLVGRVKTQKSGLQNLAEYACGGLYSFNLHIDEGASTKMFGEATFAYIYAIPQNMGLIPRSDGTLITGEFDMYGNTVTVFGRWYKDFGTAGVFVMTCLVSWFYSWLFYSKIIYSSNRVREHHLARIFYCHFMTGLIWAGYDDRIAALMTTHTITLLILVTVLYRMLIVDKFKLF